VIWEILAMGREPSEIKSSESVLERKGILAVQEREKSKPAAIKIASSCFHQHAIIMSHNLKILPFSTLYTSKKGNIIFAPQTLVIGKKVF